MKQRKSVLTSFVGLLGLGLLISGCGFKPVYRNTQTLAINQELKKIYIPTMGGRYGQQMRQYLQQNMASDGPENPKTYILDVSPGLSEEAIDIHRDNSSGRTRVLGNAHWTLKTVSTEPVVLAQGDVQTVDGYNVSYEQYFAQMLNDETVQGRVAKQLADDVTQQVAMWFETRDATQYKAKLPQTPTATYILPGLTPGDNGEAQTQKAGSDGFPAMATGRTTIVPQGMDNIQNNNDPNSGM